MTGIISFLSGSVFRMLWGEIASFWSKSQDHKQELERLRLQGELDAAAHDRQMAMAKLQHDMGADIIRVQGAVDIDKLAAATFDKGVEITGRTTGIRWIDGWNAAIRAALATEVMVLLLLHHAQQNWKLDDKGWELAGAVLGVFVADRLLFRRGK